MSNLKVEGYRSEHFNLEEFYEFRKDLSDLIDLLKEASKDTADNIQRMTDFHCSVCDFAERVTEKVNCLE